MNYAMKELSGNVFPIRARELRSEETPLLTVFCWTHNDRRFIESAIDSILEQQTSFAVEIIIHDDASTDGTVDVVNEYSAQYPTLFRNIMHAENQWSRGLSIMRGLWEAPRGQFVALIHGDDCWTDTTKLQTQVKFLLNNPDCTLCGHQFTVIDDAGKVQGTASHMRKAKGTLEDILLVNYVHTSTAVYRKACLVIDPRVTFPSAADWFLWTKLAQHGGVGFVNLPMSFYRIHDGGIASGQPIERRLTDVRKSVAVMHEALEHRYERIRRQSLAIYEIQCCTSLLYRNRRYDTLKVLALFLRLMGRAPIFAVQQPEMKVLCGAVHSRISAVRVHGWQSMMKVFGALRRRGSVVKQFMKRRFRT